MPVQSEGYYLSDLLKLEMEELYSREQVTVLSGQALKMGHVVGKIKAGTVPTTGTAGSNSGANTMTSVTGGVAVKPGIYTMKCILVVASGGVYSVTDPDGQTLPDAAVGIAYVNSQINFTLSDIGADAALGDSFTVTVPAGSGKVKELAVTAIDGAAKAYGIMTAPTDTTATTKKYIAYTSGGAAELLPGAVVTGATSAATAQVVSLTLTSGTWAAGTAAGVLILDNQVGTFQSENLDGVAQANICTIGANTAAYYPDTPTVAIVREAKIVPAYLTWPTGFSAAQIATALAQLYDKGIITATEA